MDILDNDELTKDTTSTPEKINIVEKFESQFKLLRQNWNEIIFKLSDSLRGDLKNIIDLQAEVSSYRQQLCDDISRFTYMLYKENSTYKEKWKERHIYYTTKYQVKITDSARKEYVEVDLDIYDKKMKCIDEHVKFLVESRKTVDNISYFIKNKITIFEITSIE